MKRFGSPGRWSRVTRCRERSSVAAGCRFVMKMTMVLWYTQLPGGISDCWLWSRACLHAAADLALPWWNKWLGRMKERREGKKKTQLGAGVLSLLPVSAGAGSIWIAGPRCHRGDGGHSCSPRPGVNAGVVWAGLTPHNSGHCAREARRLREQGRNYAVPQGPAFPSSCALLRRPLREV